MILTNCNLLSVVLSLLLSYSANAGGLDTYSLAQISVSSDTSLPASENSSDDTTMRQVYSWLKGYDEKHYGMFFSGTYEIYKLEIRNKCFITLNKNSVLAYSPEIGYDFGLFGEAYIETRVLPANFYVNKTIYIQVTPFSSINIKTIGNKEFRITLVKGRFKVQDSSNCSSYDEVGKQIVFDPFGKQIGKSNGDTAAIMNWTKQATLVTFYENGNARFHRPPSDKRP